MTTLEQEEASLIRSIANGDRAAFERLYFAYQRRLFGYLFRTLGETGAAEELVNDVMFEVWKNAGHYRGESKLSTWILGIAHHRMLNHLRRQRPYSAHTEILQNKADPAEQPEQAAVRQQFEESMHQALDQLPPPQREVVELAFCQSCSYEEIAGIAGCPVNTVKTRMFHAKKKLCEILVRMGVSI